MSRCSRCRGGCKVDVSYGQPFPSVDCRSRFEASGTSRRHGASKRGIRARAWIECSASSPPPELSVRVWRSRTRDSSSSGIESLLRNAFRFSNRGSLRVPDPALGSRSCQIESHVTSGLQTAVVGGLKGRLAAERVREPFRSREQTRWTAKSEGWNLQVPRSEDGHVAFSQSPHPCPVSGFAPLMTHRLRRVRFVGTASLRSQSNVFRRRT